MSGQVGDASVTFDLLEACESRDLYTDHAYGVIDKGLVTADPDVLRTEVVVTNTTLDEPAQVFVGRSESLFRTA